MSARTNRAWLVAIAALAGCIEPSKIEDDALIAAASLRDGSVDLLPELGGAGGSGGAGGIGGAGGGAGRSGSGGAGGAGGAAGAAASNCGDVVATYLLPTCATEFCHGAMGTGTSPLKLMATNTSAGLIGTGASMDCDGEVYIDAEAPEQSLLYTKLGSDPPCGLRMPFGGTPATDAQRACVLEWIMDEVAQ